MKGDYTDARTDEDLAAAYVGGDAAAFELLYSRFYGRLLRMVRQRVGRAELAEEIVQQTFLQAHRARRDFDTTRRYAPWLFTICRNLTREHYRRRARRPETPMQDAGEHLHTEAHDPVLADRARMLYRALEKLSPPQREVVVLHWLEGFSFGDVANIVGASRSAVKVRAHRAYGQLREAFGELTGNQNGDPAVLQEGT